MKKPLNNQQLKKKFWKVFSEYIRRRDANWQGYVACVSCGVMKHWKEMDAGHYIPKTGGLSIYFEEKNVHPQCTACNRFRHGNSAQYALYLRKRYGDQILEELEWKRRKIVSISSGEYLRLIEEYKNKINGFV